MTHSPPNSSLALWVRGARLRTLPLAFGPVLLGSASAWNSGSFNSVTASLALLVAVALQIGVNYANDYSDGVRGTDNHRVGPPRLTGSGAMEPFLVKRAALLSFAVAVLAGAALILISQAWSLVLLGVLAIWAAWTYTGGTRPYGYRGLGELVVFIFFGPVATAGTAYVQAGFVPSDSLILGVAMGFFASAVLLINNLRDLSPDAEAGKRTLSVQIGPRASKVLTTLLLVLPFLLLVLLVNMFPLALFVLPTAILPVFAGLLVWRGTSSSSMISALQITSASSLVYSVALSAAIIFQ